MTAKCKPHVVYWQNIPSPYVVGRFNAIADRDNLNFEAWFNEEREPDRSWDVNQEEWRFRARYIAPRFIVGQRLHVPLYELRQRRPDLFISLYDRAGFALGSLAARAGAARTAFRVLPNYDSWSDRSLWKEIGKHILFQMVDGAKVPGPDGARLAGRYGLPPQRACTVTQSIDLDHYSRARTIDGATRQQERRRLGLHGCTFVYVGRLWAGKGLDYLVDAYQTVQAAHPAVSLLLVGDGIDEQRYRGMVRDVPGVVFAGFVQPREVPDYYALADVMVFPTLGDPHGLVVDEAIAAGLPVICTTAAGDIRRRLPDGRAGYIVPPYDAAALAGRMLRLAADPALRRRFVVEATPLVTTHMHQQYARDFELFVGHLLALPARHSAASIAARAAGQGLLIAGTRGHGAPAPYLTES